MKLLCIQNFDNVNMSIAAIMGIHIPEIGDTWEEYKRGKCDCGCTIGYLIPLIDPKIVWPWGHFIEIDTSETEEMQTGKIADLVY